MLTGLNEIQMVCRIK